MPKIYRVMFEADGKPRAGEEANMLGARPVVDIPVKDNFVLPDTGGISVNGCPCSIPPTIAPRRLRNVVPGAKNTNPDGRSLWSSGTGEFTESTVFEQLFLRIRKAEEIEMRQKGYIEPDHKMSFDSYQKAIKDTRTLWNLDEQRNPICPICGQPK